VIGPAHAADPPAFGPLLAAASPKVASLFGTWWRATNRVRRLHLMERTAPPTIYTDAMTDEHGQHRWRWDTPDGDVQAWWVVDPPRQRLSDAWSDGYPIPDDLTDVDLAYVSRLYDRAVLRYQALTKYLDPKVFSPFLFLPSKFGRAYPSSTMHRWAVVAWPLWSETDGVDDRLTDAAFDEADWLLWRHYHENQYRGGWQRHQDKIIAKASAMSTAHHAFDTQYVTTTASTAYAYSVMSTTNPSTGAVTYTPVAKDVTLADLKEF
jgi:hypothetical protein